MGGLILGQQLSAGRALIKLTQEELVRAADLHVNSIRYLERQARITTGFSSERVEQAMMRFGVTFFRTPSPGVRLCGPFRLSKCCEHSHRFGIVSAKVLRSALRANSATPGSRADSQTHRKP